MWVIAIRRELDWVYGPSGDEVLRDDDVLFLRGHRDGIDQVRVLAGGVPRELTVAHDEARLTNLDRAVDIVVELKDVAEAAVGLAYSSILLRDLTLASEVTVIEDRSDELFHQLERWVLRAAAELDEPEVLRGLLHLASASERIVDAAQSMCRVIDAETPPHPIIAAALAQADEIVAEALVAEGSELDGGTLGALRVHSETGMEVLAVQRNGRWLYRPRGTLPLRRDDRLIALGPDEGARRLRVMCGDDRPESEEGWIAVAEPEDPDG